jgi:hypothetical protein
MPAPVYLPPSTGPGTQPTVTPTPTSDPKSSDTVTISVKTGTLLALLGGLLGTGGGGMVQWMQAPDKEQEDRIEELEDRIDAYERDTTRRLDEIEKIAVETYQIVDRAHPRSP